MSKRNKKQRELQSDNSDTIEGVDSLGLREVIERLHPSLQESFVPLPPAGTRLTPKQLEAVFGGDLRGLHEIARLVHQTGEFEAKS